MKLALCPTHAIILDVARAEMAQHQRFMKESVLRATPFARGQWEEQIYWPYVRQQIEHELGGELLTPIPATNGRWDPHIHPEKFLPSNRHPTAGYARVSALTPEIASAWANRRYRYAVGVFHSMERLIDTYQKQGIAIDYHPATLPPLHLPGHSPTA
jgi:hypothetical protein